MGDRQRQVFRQHQKKENYSKKKMAQKRKGLTLDLNAAAGVGPSGLGIFSKKSKLAASHILTSPDVQKLKLSSPELAEFLTRNPTLATPTPSGGNYIFPKTVTEEQESYVKGFEVALKNLQQHQIPEQTITGSHIGLPSVIKNEPNTRTSIETIEKATAAHRAAASKLVVPNNSKEGHLALSSVPEFSPRPESSASGSMDSAELRIKEEMDDSNDDFDDDDSFSDEESVKTPAPKGRGGGRSKKITPINIESQEKIKLERKRLRNRLAASKCRKRKLERISQLEVKVKDLKGENSELYNVVKKLKQSVANLKQEVIDHCSSGCQINGNVLNFSTT